MIRTEKLKDTIKREGYTIKTLSQVLGIDRSTFYNKLKNRTFTIKEIEIISQLLHIEDPIDMFFAVAS